MFIYLGIQGEKLNDNPRDGPFQSTPVIMRQQNGWKVKGSAWIMTSQQLPAFVFRTLKMCEDPERTLVAGALQTHERTHQSPWACWWTQVISTSHDQKTRSRIVVRGVSVGELGGEAKSTF